MRNLELTEEFLSMNYRYFEIPVTRKKRLRYTVGHKAFNGWV